MVSPSERRAFPRVSVQCPIKYFYLPPSLNPPDTRVIDLSQVGACIEVPDPLILGSVIAFHIITSERGVVNAQARVVHVQAKANTFFRVGVQFVSPSENARALIARELEGAQQRKSLSEVTHGSFSQPFQNETRAA